jgi:hypothetical protein
LIAKTHAAARKRRVEGADGVVEGVGSAVKRLFGGEKK